MILLNGTAATNKQTKNLVNYLKFIFFWKIEKNETSKPRRVSSFPRHITIQLE